VIYINGESHGPKTGRRATEEDEEEEEEEEFVIYHSHYCNYSLHWG